NLVLLATSDGPVPILLSSTGQRLRTFGTPGMGPGALVAPFLVFSQEDTLYFLDRGKASLVRYTESGTYLDETPTSGSLRGFSSQSARFPGGTFLTSSRFATEASFGLPFHLFDG